jgi:hypothetical protein
MLACLSRIPKPKQVGNEQVAEGGEIKRSEAKVFDWRVMGYRGGGAAVASEASTRRLMTSKWWRRAAR